MRDLERVRYVAGNYERLWGLRFVPVGLFMFLIAYRDSGLGPSWLQPGQLSAPLLLALALMFVLMWIAREYYRRTYGRVLQRASGRSVVLDVVIGLAVFGGVLSVNWLDFVLQPTVSLTGLVVVSLLALWWFVTGSVRHHYMLLSILLLGLTFLPLLKAPFDPRFPFDDSVNASLISGVGFIVIGVGDHLLLARTFRAVPEEGDDAVRRQIGGI